MNPEGNRNGQRRSLWKGPAAVAALFLVTGRFKTSQSEVFV
jgi:hypothetical protein